MKKRLIALAFSDLHLSDWGKYSTRKDTAEKIFERLVKISHEEKIPIIHCGDFFHKSEVIGNEFLSEVIYMFKRLERDYPDYKMIFISGNHSCATVNSVEKMRIISWENTLSKVFPNLESIDFMFHIIEQERYKLGKDIMLHGVPYLDGNVGLAKYLKNLNYLEEFRHILLLHSDFPGAKDNNGIEIGSVENFSVNLLDRFDLVLMGHIHKPQRLSKKVYMLGAPYQQRFSDKEAKLGYWELYSDLSMKFVELDNYPKFIEVDSHDKVRDDGNYYNVITKPVEQEQKEEKRITLGMSKKRAVKRYLKINGVDDKKKEEILLGLIKKAEDND